MSDPASVFPTPPYPYHLPPPRPTGPPAVVMWFKLYAGLLAFSNLLMVPSGIVMAIMSFVIDEPDASVVFLLSSLVMIFGGLVLSVLFAVPIFLKPRPWVWIYSVIIIAMTMMQLCCLPLAVPLVYYWVREDNRRYHGMQ